MTAKVSLSFYQKRHVYKVVKMPKGGKGKKKKEKQVQDGELSRDYNRTFMKGHLCSSSILIL